MSCEVPPDTATITVLSLNCWGIHIPFVAKDYKERINAIRQRLFKSDSKFDVICLQEIWNKNDYLSFQEEAKKHSLPYSHYFYSGVLGSGVCVFSRWRITMALFHKWQVNGYVHKICHGDWYGGKGIGLCKLDVNGFKVNIYTCHVSTQTHAEYSVKTPDAEDTDSTDSWYADYETEYIAHRVVQAFDLAQFIHASSADADLTVLAADLNTEPNELCYSIIRTCAELLDSFDQGNAKKIYLARKKCFLGTYNCESITYHDAKVAKKCPDGQRIDHILYKAGENASVNCMSYNKPLESKVPGKEFSYSDHEAISTTFEVRKVKQYEPHMMKSVNIIPNPVEKSTGICEKAVKALEGDIKKIILFMIVFFIVCLVAFLTTLYTNYVPAVTSIIFLLLALFVLLILLITLLWKIMELNGIRCTLHEMQIYLKDKIL